MHPITIEQQADPQKLKSLGVADWPIWQKEVSVFPWFYDEPETALILEGEVWVTPENAEPVFIQAGDLVTFSAGLSCTWDIRQPLKKHYRFG